MISVSLEPKWRHFAQVNIADIFMLSSKLPKQNENKEKNNIVLRKTGYSAYLDLVFSKNISLLVRVCQIKHHK